MNEINEQIIKIDNHKTTIDHERRRADINMQEYHATAKAHKIEEDFKKREEEEEQKKKDKKSWFKKEKKDKDDKKAKKDKKKKKKKSKHSDSETDELPLGNSLNDTGRS